MEVYSERTFKSLGIDCQFVQDNHSLSVEPFVLRGLHLQRPPYTQAKLVRCVRGRIFDVVVDVRQGSATYGKWVGTELSQENGNQLFVPVGFAHGFLTLEANSEVIYKCSDFYAPSHEDGIRWDSVGIEWPLPTAVQPQLSDKDMALSSLAEFSSPFSYDGKPLADLH